MSKLNVGNDSSGNNTNTQVTNTNTQVANANTNQYLKVNYNNSIKDLLIPTKDTLDQLKESGVVHSAKKLETGTSLNTDLSKTDPFNFDGSTETGNLGITGTLPIEHGGTGATSRTEALTALQAGGGTRTDANIVASGTYVLNTDNGSNLPSESGYYLLTVFRYDTSDLACGQIAINLSNGNLYSRNYVAGSWRNWVQCSSHKIDTISIPDGADLNDEKYRQRGFYASYLSSNNISNMPSDYNAGHAFELTVTGISNSSYSTQWLKSYNSNKVWVRTQTEWQSPWTWTNWEQIVLPSTSLDGLELGKSLPSTAANGGYIDFHYNGSTEDYTTRLIETSQGTLGVKGNLDVTGWLQCSNGLWIAGGGFYASNNNSNVYGTSLPSAGTKGRIFFKKAEKGD